LFSPGLLQLPIDKTHITKNLIEEIYILRYNFPGFQQISPTGQAGSIELRSNTAEQKSRRSILARCCQNKQQGGGLLGE